MTDSPPPPSPRTVRCPGCGGPSLYAASNPHRPFCSPRCKNGDLGAWANEQYRVPVRPQAADDDEAMPPPAH